MINFEQFLFGFRGLSIGKIMDGNTISLFDQRGLEKLFPSAIPVARAWTVEGTVHAEVDAKWAQEYSPEVRHGQLRSLASALHERKFNGAILRDSRNNVLGDIFMMSGAPAESARIVVPK